MFCPNCGRALESGSRFCSGCGCALASFPAGEPGPFRADRPSPSPDARGTGTGFPAPRPAGPFYWVLRILLILAVVFYPLLSLGFFTGLILGGGASELYAACPALQPLNIAYGVCCLGLAVLAFFAGRRLKRFRRGAGLLCCLTWALALIADLTYLGLAAALLKLPFADTLDAVNLFSLLVHLVLLPASIGFFLRNRRLFVS